MLKAKWGRGVKRHKKEAVLLRQPLFLNHFILVFPKIMFKIEKFGFNTFSLKE
jgi:hypothetical protein